MTRDVGLRSQDNIVSEIEMKTRRLSGGIRNCFIWTAWKAGGCNEEVRSLDSYLATKVSMGMCYEIVGVEFMRRECW